MCDPSVWELASRATSMVEQALSSELKGLSVYPATAGMPVLREACAQWANKRYGIELDAATQVLPVNGSR